MTNVLARGIASGGVASLALATLRDSLSISYCVLPPPRNDKCAGEMTNVLARGIASGGVASLALATLRDSLSISYCVLPPPRNDKCASEGKLLRGDGQEICRKIDHCREWEYGKM